MDLSSRDDNSCEDEEYASCGGEESSSHGGKEEDSSEAEDEHTYADSGPLRRCSDTSLDKTPGDHAG